MRSQDKSGHIIETSAKFCRQGMLSIV